VTQQGGGTAYYSTQDPIRLFTTYQEAAKYDQELNKPTIGGHREDQNLDVNSNSSPAIGGHRAEDQSLPVFDHAWQREDQSLRVFHSDSPPTIGDHRG
jgi:hypothetical protein